MTLVVNFFGGPGSGKSSLTGGLFYRLKNDHYINCEMAREVAKGFVWEGRESVLKDQDYVTACQRQLLDQLIGKVDVVICDSPILLGSIYAEPEYPKSFHDFTLWTFNRYRNLNFIVNRTKPFDPNGRRHDEIQSRQAHEEIRNMLLTNSIPFHETVTDGLDFVVDTVLKHLVD